MTGWTRLIAGAFVLGVLLGYLRDPPWILRHTYGLHAAEVQSDGTTVRWTRGHAAIHVPSDLRSVIMPLRSIRESPSDWPITALITVDDVPAERVTFQDEAWQIVAVRLPPRGSRRARRIDIKLDRVRSDNLGIQLAR